MTEPNIIQATKPAAIQLRTEKMVIPHRGQISSMQLNRFHDQVLSDLMELANQGNIVAKAVLNYAHVLQRETDQTRQLAISMREQLSFNRKVTAKQGRRVGLWVDLHDASMISFLEGSSPSRRAQVSTQFGQATIPMNAVESKAYSVTILGTSGITSMNVIASCTGIFDAGDGVQNYEGGLETPTIEQTDLKNAANGSNIEYWRRRVIFDLESDVAEVECEVTFQMPDQSSIQANVLYLHPFPLGTVDITGLWICPDLGQSFVQVPKFEVKEGAGKTRWFFPTQNVAKVKIRMKQRNWTEENGRKVFEYGLQELGVQLVEWDKTYDAAAGQISDNHAFVTKIEAEPGMRLSKLYGFYATPNYLLEPVGNRHLHFTIAKDAAGSDIIWNSDQSPSPQSLSAPIELGAVTEVYVITVMNWCVNVSSGSPFQAGCPPFIEGFGIDVTMVESS